MTPHAEIKLPALRRRRRDVLLGGSALCGAVMLLAQPAQSLPDPTGADIKVSVGGLVPVFTPSPVVLPTALGVELKAARTVINWTTGFAVGAGESVNFKFLTGSDIVLNKSTSAVTVAAGGSVTGKVGLVTGGNIWFYSPNGVLIAPGATMTAGNFVFSRGVAIDDLMFVDLAKDALTVLRSASDSLIQIDTLSSATTATISATGDVVLSAATGDLNATVVLGAGATSVTATTGSVTLGEVTSTGGAVTVKALGGAAGVTTAVGATSLLVSASTTATVILAKTTVSGDVSVTGGTSASVTTGDAIRDLMVSGPNASLGAGDAKRDVLVTGGIGGATVLGHATAGDDVEIISTFGAVNASGATLTSTGVGAIDDAHVLVRSSGGLVNVGTAVTAGTAIAAGDITIDGSTGSSLGSGNSTRDLIVKGTIASLASGTAVRDVNVTGSVSAAVGSGSAGRDVAVIGPVASLTSGDATGDIVVTATAGAATIGDHATAGDDVEVTAVGAVAASTATLTSKGLGADDGHVTAKSATGAVNVGAAVTSGVGAATGDITMDAATSIDLGSADTSRDLKFSAATASLTTGKAKRDLIVTGTTSASVGSGTAGRDILVTGPVASLTSGDTATGNIIVKATGGAATVGNLTAGDDVEVTATGNVEGAGGTLTSKGLGADDGHVQVASTGGEAKVGAGVTLGTGAKAGDVKIDGSVKATVGSGSDSSHDLLITAPIVTVGSGKAKNDLIVTGTTSASVGSGSAGRDILVTGPVASLTSGDTATGDIVVKATGGAATVGNLTAGDDVEVTATGNVEGAGGTLTSKGLGADDGHVQVASTGAEAKVGAGVTLGTGAKAGDVTINGSTGVTVGTGSKSGRDFVATATTGKVTIGSAHADADVVVTAPGGSIDGGALEAGRDIAISTPIGNIALTSGLAGDDIVIRAPLGSIDVTGDLKAGRDLATLTAADAPGAGDTLNAAQPFLDWDAAPTTIFTAVGFDVNISGQAVHVAGATVAGHQPSTEAPDGSVIDTSTSDVRIQTLVSATTPTADLAPSIILGSVIATRDVQIDSYKAVTTGAIVAGRDIAILGRGGVTPGAPAGDHTGAGVTIGSARAGDDVVAYSIFGHAHVLGDVTSRSPIKALQPSTDTTIDGATQAADQLRIYLDILDLDKKSKGFVSTSSAILIRGETVAIDGKLTAMGSGSVGVRSMGNLTVSGNVSAGLDANFATESESAAGSALSLNTVTAGGNIVVFGGDFGTSNTVTATTLDATGGNVTVAGHSVGLGTTTAGGDVGVSGDSITMDSTGAGGNVVVRGGGVSMGGTTAGGDVDVSGGTIGMGTTTAGRDVAVRGVGVTMGATSAKDDVVVRGATISLTGAVTAGGGPDAVGAGDALVTSAGAVTLGAATFDVAGRQDIDIKATGKVTATGALTASADGSDVRVQAGDSIGLVNATAKRDVLVAAGTTINTGLLDAGRDIGAIAPGNVTISGATAKDDVAIRGGGDISTGAVTAGGGADADGAADLVVKVGGAVTLEGKSFDVVGRNDIDIKATGKVTATGALTADTSLSDVRVQAGGAISLADAKADRDVLIDGKASVTTGNLTAVHRDVGVRSTTDGFDVQVGDVLAGDDVVIRGNANIKAGALTAKGEDSAAADQAGDLMFNAAKSKLNGDLTLAGQNVDVRSTKGSITVTGAAVADTDARFQTEKTTGGSANVASVTAGENVLLDGASVGAGGALTATIGDVAVRARSGAATLASISAGDDVVIRASGAITAGSVSTLGKSKVGLADGLIVESGKLTVEGHSFDLAGSEIDVVGGAVTLGSATAASNVRIKAGSNVSLGGGRADAGDILIDSAGSVSTGGLTASGDIGVRATGGGVDVGAATAGDDVVLRATSGITAGALTAGSSEVTGAADLLFGPNPTSLRGEFDLGGGNVDVKADGGSASVSSATAPNDIRVQASGEARLSGDANAGRDILLDGSSVSGGALKSGGDIALFGRSGAVSLGSAAAGDDLAIRATGSVTATGALSAGAGADSDGAADRLISVAGGMTVAGATFDLSGGAVDVRGAGITVSGSTSAVGGNGNVRLQSSGALTLGAGSATTDILLDASGAISAGALNAGRDIGVRSTGADVTIASGTAGDDIVVRALKGVRVTDGLTARGDTDGVGAADLLFDTDRTGLVGAFDLAGSNVDVKSGEGSISALGGVNAATDVRLQTANGPGGDITTGDVTAGRDVLLDGTAVTAGAVKGGRDIAGRARLGGLTLGSGDAGDDLVLRAAGDILVLGSASARGGTDADGVGDRLFGTDRTRLNGDFDLAGANLDAKSSGGAIGIRGAVKAGRDARLQTTGGGAVTTAGVDAGRDIFADGGLVRATGDLRAGGDVALRGRTGTVEVASISAGDDIAVRAAGDFSAGGALTAGSTTTSTGAADRLISASEGGMILRQVDPKAAPAPEGFTLGAGDIDIRSGGALSVAGAMSAAKSGVHLQSTGKTSLAAVSADSIFVRGSDLLIGGAWKATSARIESTAAGGLGLGASVAGAMSLDQAQIDRIDAATLQIFAGDTSGTMRGGAISIGALAIDVAKIRSALEFYAGSNAEVRITGLFAPSSGAANATALRIGANGTSGNWTPKTIKVIADNGGAIGFSTTTDGRAFNGVRAFGTVELNATADILMGYQDFIDKLSATSAADVANVVKAFHAAQGPSGSRMLLTAGALTLRADGKVAQQDMSPLGALTRTGIFLSGAPTAGDPSLTIDGMTKAPLGTVTLPQYVELYGAMKSNVTVLANENAALSNLIAVKVKPSQYYRLNTCVILQTGACSPAGGPPNTNIAPERLTALDVANHIDTGAAADPTVASATNEEIWKSPE